MATGRNGTVAWRSIGRRLAIGAGMLTGAALAGSAAVGFITAEVLTRPRRAGPYLDYTISPHEVGIPYEDVRFLCDEHALLGWWLARPESKRVIIVCHGYRGGKFEVVGIAAALWRAGYNVLMFDFNHHRPGHVGPVTLGYHCDEDVLAAVAYAKGRVPGASIGVLGYSMGASVAILSAARCQDIRAVVADTPFSTHAAVVAQGIRRLLHIPGEPFMPFTDIFLQRLAGYHHRDVEPVREAAAIAPRPFLLIHGSEDSICPVEQGYAVYAAAGEPKELWVVEGAEHCGAYFEDRTEYTSRLTEWFDRNLPIAAASEDTAAPSGTRATVHALAQPRSLSDEGERRA